MLLVSSFSAWVAVSSVERAVARVERRRVCWRRRERSVGAVVEVVAGRGVGGEVALAGGRGVGGG